MAGSGTGDGSGPEELAVKLLILVLLLLSLQPIIPKTNVITHKKTKNFFIINLLSPP